MLIKKIAAPLIIVAFVFGLTGCVKVNTSTNNQNRPDAGFFISLNKGDSWAQQTAILATGGALRNFSMDSAASFAIDPSDPKTMYFGTFENGMLYSLDRGVSWQVALTLGPGTVSSIAIDPTNKCMVYAAMGNRVLRTNDCLRTWKTVFTDTTENIQVTSIDIDHFNAKNVYITLSRGDLVKSTSNGDAWQTIYRFGSKIKKFAMDPNDSRRMYVDTAKDGLNVSEDGGAKWSSMKKIFEEYKISGEIVDIELIKGQANQIYLATEKGIIRSADKGKTWEQLKLIPPSNNASIDSLVINPKNTNEIYYVAASTFYRSIDGGANWTVKPLPTTKKGKIIEIDETDPKILYLAVSRN